MNRAKTQLGEDKQKVIFDTAPTGLRRRKQVDICVRAADNNLRLTPKGQSLREEACESFNRTLVIIAKIHVEKELGRGSLLEDLEPHQVDVGRRKFGCKGGPFCRYKKGKSFNIRVGERFRKGFVGINFEGEFVFEDNLLKGKKVNLVGSLQIGSKRNFPTSRMADIEGSIGD